MLTKAATLKRLRLTLSPFLFWSYLDTRKIMFNIHLDQLFM